MRSGDIGFVLWLVFLVFVVGWLGAFLAFADSHRLVDRLAGNPQRYLGYVETTLIFLIAPAVAELAFIILPIVWARTPWIRALSWWPVLAAYGVLFVAFGARGLLVAGDQLAVVHDVAARVREPLVAIYGSAVVGFALWTVAGVLFLVVPFRKRRVGSR